MRVLTPPLLTGYMDQLKVRANLRRRLRLSAITSVPSSEWDDRELYTIPTKDGRAGLLFMVVEDRLYGLPYELSDIRDAVTGRSKPVICDFCRTWQAGGRAASITFQTDRRSLNVIGFLCCADLECSLHVRDKTPASKMSRAQLREDVTREQRIGRLQEKLRAVQQRLDLQPLDETLA